MNRGSWLLMGLTTHCLLSPVDRWGCGTAAPDPKVEHCSTLFVVCLAHCQKSEVRQKKMAQHSRTALQGTNGKALDRPPSFCPFCRSTTTSLSGVLCTNGARTAVEWRRHMVTTKEKHLDVQRIIWHIPILLKLSVFRANLYVQKTQPLG